MLKYIFNFPQKIIEIRDFLFEIRAIGYDLKNRLIEQDYLINDLIKLTLAQLDDLPKPFILETEYPIAIESADHIYPWGTLNDNSRSSRFVRSCETVLRKEKIKVMDMGCAGGGLVQDFLTQGHRAIGLEGSDASLKRRRVAWRLFPEHLKTCDITKPFTIKDSNKIAYMDIICAWEVMEHIHQQDLPQLISNIAKHLHADGLFVASVATTADINEEGVDYHVTQKPKEWWLEIFEKNGLIEAQNHGFVTADFVRGRGNGPMDWNVEKNPECGFHVVLKRKS